MAAGSHMRMRKVVSITDIVEKPELLLEQKSFKTEDVRTSIALLRSQNYKVLLKTVGTLGRYAAKDVRYLEQYVSFGIYPQLLDLLHNKDADILKFTLKLLAMLAKNNFMSKCSIVDVLICSEMCARYYIQNEDIFVKECCSLILLQHVKYSEVISNQIYSGELVEAIFAALAGVKDVDVLWNSLSLFHEVLDIEMAKEDIARSEFFSVKVLVCLLGCEQKGVRELVMDIFHKLSNWCTKGITRRLTDEGLLQVLVDFLKRDGPDVLRDKAYEILRNCFTNEECACEFCMKVKFREFIVWLKNCSNRNLLGALPILTILTKIPKLRQRLYDLSVDQLALSWMKYQHETVILHLLQIISNLTEHKRCCKTFSKYVVIKTIRDYILNENLPIDIYGELALETLRNLLVRSPGTLDHFIACDCVSLIQDFFLTRQKELSPRAYANVISIVRLLLLTPKSAKILLVPPVLRKIFTLYRKNREFKYKMLNLINVLIKHEAFRNFVVEEGKSEVIFSCLRNEHTSFGLQLHLALLSNLLKYKDIANHLLDLDILSFMKTIRKSVDLQIVNNIIEDLYDYCLTMKFYETHRLEAHNKLDEKFYLIQDEKVKTSSILSMDFSSSNRPVYVVSVMLVKVIKEVERSVTSYRSSSSIRPELVSAGSRKRILSISSTKAQSNVKLKAVCEHGQIPEKVLMQRIGWSGNDVYFYEDYYLERYILNLMRQLYYSDDAPQTLEERIEHIAKFVVRQLSGIFLNLKETEEGRVFYEHLSRLKESIGMPVVPVGFLRIGYFCERALLFKVLCDNLCVPTTLCRRDVDIYWNEVRFTVIHNDESFVQKEGTVYIVDLMCNVGSLIPMNSLEAQEYLCVETCV